MRWRGCSADGAPPGDLPAVTDWLGPEEWQAVRLSLGVAGRLRAASLVPAVLVAWALARERFPGRPLLDALVHLPLVLPPVVIGWLLLILFGIRGPIGALLHDWFGIRLVFTTAGAALACAVMSLPADGARDPAVAGGRRPRPGSRRRAPWAPGRLDRLFSVTLPLMSPGILVGRGVGLRRLPRRIRRGHHLRLQHPGRDPDPAAGDLQRAAGARAARRWRHAWSLVSLIARAGRPAAGGWSSAGGAPPCWAGPDA